MRLLHLKLHEPFRSLQGGFKVKFLRGWDGNNNIESLFSEFAPYVLAGRNGSGKSNVLEVLAAIFHHVECQFLNRRPENFDFHETDNPSGFQAEIAVPNAFELEYLLPVLSITASPQVTALAHIRIEKSVSTRTRVLWLNREFFDGKAAGEVERLDVFTVLPEFVLAYSSGENEILSLPFFKARFIQFDEYWDALKSQTPYDGRPESRRVYLDDAFSQAIILCNLLFHDENVLEPFRREVGLERIEQFRIMLKRRIEVDAAQASSMPDELVEVEEDESEQGQDRYFLKILDKFEIVETGLETFLPLVNRLQRCATLHFHDRESNCLILDFWVNDATKEAFRHNFESAIDLFQSLQMLLTLNLYPVNASLKRGIYASKSHYVKETVPVLPSDQQVMKFKFFKLATGGVEESIFLRDLSDGEHQFLHSLGLCLLFKDSNSLFLLDEPETHFNPDWRSKFISSLRDCFANTGRDKQREMLITTHSPFLISDSRPEHVLVFEKKDGLVSVETPKYNTLGASINKITMSIFGKRETIGGYAEGILEGLRQRFEEGEDKGKIIAELNYQLGDSVEKMVLIRTILESMEARE